MVEWIPGIQQNEEKDSDREQRQLSVNAPCMGDCTYDTAVCMSRETTRD